MTEEKDIVKATLSETTQELAHLGNRYNDDPNMVTQERPQHLPRKIEIEYLREMHRIGQSLIDFAKGRSRELSDQICEIAGPEISKRNRG